jgi:peptidoglycan hydrolase-like protein with peptidoglycan-binding domain
MAPWKITTAAALASLMFAAPAFAQATTGSPAKSEGMKSDTMKSGAMRGRKGDMAMAGDEKVKAAQQALKDKGHDPGSVDGKMGPKTQAALRDFQKAQGMEATGRLDMKTIQSLGMDGGKTSSAGESATSGSASPATTDAPKDAAPDAPKADAPKDASGSGSPATGEKKTEEKKY